MGSRSLQTLRSRREFVLLSKKGKRFRLDPWVILNFRSSEVTLGQPKFGWTIPKYVGVAVTRNRVRRWCREIARLAVESVPEQECRAMEINVVLRKCAKDTYRNVKYDEFKNLLYPALQKVLLSRHIESGLKFLALLVINFYRVFLSNYFGNGCRFVPSCSEYGKHAFQTHGFVRAFLLTAKRIGKCRPGGSYGYDPVPQQRDCCS